MEDSVKLKVSIDVDTARNSSVYIESGALDYKMKQTRRFPGVTYLDDKVILLEGYWSTFSPKINIEPALFEGSHSIKLVFSDDMEFNFQKEVLSSAIQDSLKVFFVVDFFDIVKEPIVSKDSVSLEINKMIDGYKAYLEILIDSKLKIPVADFGLIRVSSPVINKRVAFPISAIKKKGYNEYAAMVQFLKEIPILYKTKNKGDLSLTYHVRDIRFKIQ